MHGLPLTSTSDAEISDASLCSDLVIQVSSFVHAAPSLEARTARALTFGISSGWIADIGKDSSSSSEYPSISHALELASMIWSRSGSTMKMASFECSKTVRKRSSPRCMSAAICSCSRLIASRAATRERSSSTVRFNAAPSVSDSFIRRALRGGSRTWPSACSPKREDAHRGFRGVTTSAVPPDQLDTERVCIIDPVLPTPSTSPLLVDDEVPPFGKAGRVRPAHHGAG